MKKLSLAMVAGVATLLFASAATAGSVRAEGSARAATTLKVCPDADKCFTSIQAAIDAATDGAKIKIAAGTYAGSLVIGKDITLDGTGAGETIISADANKRVITVIADVSVTIRGLTVTGGSLQFILGLDPPGDPYPDFVGGGIFVASSSSVELFDAAVSANSAFSGGGIYSEGTLTLHKSTVTGNSSNGRGGEGGGIYSEGTLTLTNTTVSDNSVSSGGVAAGISNSGPALLAKQHRP
jgi:predicted outer membrane repeat protein